MQIRRTTTSAAALAVAAAILCGAVPAAATPLDDAATGRSSGRVALAVDVLRDGSGPFTPTDGPGADSGDANGIVRTLDAITYRVTMTSNDGPSANERFVLTAPTGTTWSAVPASCTGSGSGVSGRTLTCNLGTVREGQAVAVPAVLTVSGTLHDGDHVGVTAFGTADDAGAPVTVTSATRTVSAAPRYNLAKNVQASRLVPDVTGPDGTTKGIQLVYPVAVDWQPVVPGQGLLGFESSDGRMTFSDDLSHILGDLPSQAVLWNGGQPTCGPNGRTAWSMGGLPGGSGGGADAVSDSGRFTCTQAAPGAPVDVTLTGVVTDPTHFPDTSVSGGPIAGGSRAYVVSGFISLWMPTPPIGTSVESVNTYTPLQTRSVDGTPNFPGSTEPTEDNVARRTVVEYAGGTASKRLRRIVADASAAGGTTLVAGSAKQGDPWATEGTLLRSDVAAANDGLAPFRNAVLCDTFDRTTQRLTPRGAGGGVTTTGLRSATVEYAARAMPSPAAGQVQTCDDADGPWFDRPEDVPGGIAAVGAIRATGDVPGGTTAVLSSAVVTRDAPDGTRAHDFGHVRFGDGHDGWVHDRTDPALGAGPLADSVVLTEDLARVTKKVVDPGHDAAHTPDATASVVPGNTIDYALYPTFTNGHAQGRPGEVTVQDVLPRDATYVPGSASAEPRTDSVSDQDGTVHQRLTWVLRDVRPNTAIPALHYAATFAADAPAGTATNTVVVASPFDRSDEQYRTASRAVQVVTAGGLRVQKTATHPVVVAGDRLEWTLDTTNTDTTPMTEVDLIDVLPHRGTDTDRAFHGSVRLAETVQVDTAAGERVTYSAADPTRVALDGGAASNRPGGGTRWCSEDAFGAPGCPSALGDVTAFRIQRAAPVGVGQGLQHHVAMTTRGEHDGDRYTNRFGVRVADLPLPVWSNPATISVVAGAIGDRVWSDDDRDGLQDHGEPGTPGAPVALSGQDDLGHAVRATTTTDEHGAYAFDGLRPGAYTVRFTAPDGRAFTTPLVGPDRAVDSDATADGSTAPITIDRVLTDDGALDGVTRDESVDAGVLPPQDTAIPPTPGAAAGGTTPAHGLAFTGARGLLAGLIAAALLFTAGIVLAGARRRRRHAR